ncbi:ORF42 [Ovine gammaherpesvirus 2]|uniref:ORF42 n=1 Tax=Ovine gammaherpesvirus 2 TaxID=10398 RepID=Q2VSK0_9GAMA|nr:ORF42 [Ovine gammaherpesvirus 2]AAX58076.1 ORF42 [Ovine gammaherpesvirus 2]
MNPQTPRLSSGPRAALILPRLVLEVSKNDKICVACNSPEFLSSSGNLNVKDQEAHAKARLQSVHFAGFAMCSMVACEDKVTTLDLYYHVLRERMVLYRPRNNSLAELCIITSALENCSVPSAPLFAQYLSRARYLLSKCPLPDAALLVNGIETLIATLVHWHGISSESLGGIPRGLQTYELYKDLTTFDSECKNLMTNMFCTSYKLEEDAGNEESPESSTFNLFYSPTILTRHFKNKRIISCVKEACLKKCATHHLV